jgi:hypothetical protein
MGNNINGKLAWNLLMEKHTDEIRKALTLKKKFVVDADKIIQKISTKFLEEKAKVSKKKREIILIGIHIRYFD